MYDRVEFGEAPTGSLSMALENMGKQDFTAYILAGGGSRRMGVDKLFLQFDGSSLLERTIVTCKKSLLEVKLVAGDPNRFAALNVPVVLDSPQARGPLAGVIAALVDCRADYCFITAADFFDLSAAVITSLFTQYRGQQYLGVIEPDGLQPLCGIYHQSALTVLQQNAQTGQYRMTEVVKALDHEGVALPPGLWRNINSPEDLPSREDDKGEGEGKDDGEAKTNG